MGRIKYNALVSTHSHPKVAAASQITNINKWIVSTHSHPKVAAPRRSGGSNLRGCFNTQPPEGGCNWHSFSFDSISPFQHTATRRWLPSCRSTRTPKQPFQHTATRRWLPTEGATITAGSNVSTHSHPKVAAEISPIARSF